MGRPVPNLDDWVQLALTSLRAPLKQRTVFTRAGRSTLHRSGEQVIYGPNGQPVRVIEHPEGGNQIEHGDHLHAVVRPKPVTAHIHTR